MTALGSRGVYGLVTPLVSFLNIMNTRGKIFVFLLVLSFLPASAQQLTVPVDTSYSVASTYHKLKKQFPHITIAKRNSDDVRVISDVVYHIIDATPFGRRELHADIFLPFDVKKKLPAIIMIHGGGWRSGNKSMNTTMSLALASRGFAVVSVEYRLSLEAKYPAAVDDVISAIRWTRQNAHQYQIDKEKIALVGYSAGGQLASLVGAAQGNIEFQNQKKLDDSYEVQAVVDLDGLLDFTDKETLAVKRNPTSADIAWLGGSYEEIPERWKEASALTWINRDAPPFLFINSSQTRFHAGCENMVRRLNEYGIYNQVVKFDDAPHSFWFFNPWFDPMIDSMATFLNKVFHST